MKGFNIAEQAHVVIGSYPISANGVTTLEAVNMENYAHISVLIATGATNGGAITVTAYNAADAAAGSAAVIPFNYYLETTASTDVLAAKVLNSTTALAFTNDSISNQMAVIELDAAEMTDGLPWFNITLSGAATTTPICVMYVMSGSRYEGPESPTVIS